MTATPLDPPDGLNLFDALHRKAAQQEAVADLGRLALTDTPLPELFAVAVTSARDALGTERVAILEPNAAGLLACTASVGWSHDEVRDVVPSEESQVGFTFVRAESLVVTDYAQSERFVGSRHLADIGIASGITVPLRGDEGAVGVVAAHAREARTFSDDDVLFVRGIANVLAAAMARDRADAARRRSEAQVAFLAEASHELAGSLEDRQTLERLAQLLVPVLAERCIVRVVDGPMLVQAAQKPDGAELAPVATASVVTATLATGTPASLDSLAASTREQLVGDANASIFALPLVVDNRLCALALIVRAQQPDAGEARLLTELGRRTSLALENAATHAAERAARSRAEALQRVTARLAGTLTPDEVVATVLEEVVDVTEATSGLVALVDADAETVTVSAHRGYPDATMDAWRSFAVAGDYPVSEAIRTGEAVYCETLAERNERFPVHAEDATHAHSLVALPLLGSHPLGCINLSFPDERSFDASERAFLETIARQCAQALERTMLRADLTRERSLFEAVLRNMPSGVVVGELPSLRIVLGNEQIARIWRRPLADIQSESRYDTFTARTLDGRPFTREHWPLPRLAATGERIDGELIAIERADGTQGFVSVSAAPIRDERGELAYGVVVFNDVTDETRARREAEQRAHASRALEFVGDGVCLVDATGAVRLWNRAATRITGLAEEAVLGAPLADAIPGWTRLAQQIPVTAAGADRSPRPLALPLDIAGHEVWLSVSAVSFGDGVVYAFRDVTEEQQLERMKSDFIATVSHELRTPLAAIYGAAATLRQRAGLEKATRDAFIEMIEQQSERLTQIVSDILTASRVEAGELGVELTAVDAAPVVAQVVELAQRTAPGTPVRATIDPSTPPVLADADRLRQVLGNIVENAIKYSGAGEEVTIAVCGRERHVAFEVRDRGVGIPSGDAERIFEKFYRVDANMRSGVSGTGLGLYICRELVERMGGTIAVDSAPGGGSVFTVELFAATDV
jgi:PAS domain S-box-containing protein